MTVLVPTDGMEWEYRCRETEFGWQMVAVNRQRDVWQMMDIHADIIEADEVVYRAAQLKYEGEVRLALRTAGNEP